MGQRGSAGAGQNRLEGSAAPANRWARTVSLIALLGVTIGLLAVASRFEPSDAATPPAGFVDAAFANVPVPTALTVGPDGTFYVSAQAGQITMIRPNGANAGTLLTVPTENFGTQGLFGTALHPDYPTTPWIYTYYTVRVSGELRNRVVRYTVNGSGTGVVNNSALVIYETPRIKEATVNHIGGDLQFGIDGKLYVNIGDNNAGSNGQRLDTTLGKVLRFNPDGTIPTDNPFYDSLTGDNRSIYAYGFRNPYQGAVDPVTGRHHVMDVGSTQWEEINHLVRGGNFGWSDSEGAAVNPGEQAPFFTYNHDSGNPRGNTVTGGTFYRPPVAHFPTSYVGDFFFADFGRDWIGVLDVPSGAFTHFMDALGVVDMEVGVDGALYYLSRTPSQIRRLSYSGAGTSAPVITDQPSDIAAAVGESVLFSAAAVGNPTPTLQWLRNGVEISGETGPNLSLPSVGASDDGATYQLRASNSQGVVVSDAATLTVATTTRPTAAILSPTATDRYVAGTTIAFEGQGNDDEDGPLPGTSMEWSVVFHHADHTHPFISSIDDVASGTFDIPVSGESSVDVWYRIHLTVTDSTGLTDSTFVDLLPSTFDLTLATSPPGLAVRLDGRPVITPITVQSVAGIERAIGPIEPQAAPTPQAEFVFDSWSDSSTADRVVAIGADAAFTAHHIEAPAGTIVLGNRPPTVDAGNDVTLPSGAFVIGLEGLVSDDGLPNPPSELVTQWRLEEGPVGGEVTFGDRSDPRSTATFNRDGTWLLALESSDSEHITTDAVVVVIGDPSGRCSTSGVSVEAETGTTFGMFTVAADPSASAGQAVTTPNNRFARLTFDAATNPAYVDYCMTVPFAGTHELTAVVRGPNGASNSFWVTVDDHDTATRVSYAAGAYLTHTVGQYPLAAGEHSIRFWIREDGSFLDSLLLSPVGGPPSSTTTSTSTSTTTSTTSTTTTSTTSTTTTSTTTPDGECGSSIGEAEHGDTAGNVAVVNDGGTQGVWTPERTGNALNFASAANRGSVAICVTAPSTSTYDVIARVKGPGTSSNSWWATIDDGPAIRVSFEASPLYQDRRVATLPLTAGEHAITFWVREDGTYLDSVRLRGGDTPSTTTTTSTTTTSTTAPPSSSSTTTTTTSQPNNVDCNGLTAQAETGEVSGNVAFVNDVESKVCGHRSGAAMRSTSPLPPCGATSTSVSLRRRRARTRSGRTFGAPVDHRTAGG